MELGGKVAVVTGAAMGIGFAVAKASTDAGAQVVVAALDADAGHQAATELGAHFSRASFGSRRTSRICSRKTCRADAEPRRCRLVILKRYL